MALAPLAYLMAGQGVPGPGLREFVVASIVLFGLGVAMGFGIGRLARRGAPSR